MGHVVIDMHAHLVPWSPVVKVHAISPLHGKTCSDAHCSQAVSLPVVCAQQHRRLTSLLTCRPKRVLLLQQVSNTNTTGAPQRCEAPLRAPETRIQSSRRSPRRPDGPLPPPPRSGPAPRRCALSPCPPSPERYMHEPDCPAEYSHPSTTSLEFGSSRSRPTPSVSCSVAVARDQGAGDRRLLRGAMPHLK